MTGTVVPADVAAAADPEVTAAASCDVCGHPTAAHDRISSRFCQATQSGALSRGCICRV